MKYFYIYNFKQAKYFIDNGLSVLEIAKGNSGDVYHKFTRDETSERIFAQWNIDKINIQNQY